MSFTIRLKWYVGFSCRHSAVFTPALWLFSNNTSASQSSSRRQLHPNASAGWGSVFSTRGQPLYSPSRVKTMQSGAPLPSLWRGTVSKLLFSTSVLETRHCFCKQNKGKPYNFRGKKALLLLYTSFMRSFICFLASPHLLSLCKYFHCEILWKLIHRRWAANELG